ncbi:MAG: hypothetical protein PWQ96_1771 [Clostridia bacterium]|jgi:superfamily II DNA or RNA helicase|nr:helicase [Clostridiales bacterium]MDK2986127.1 hypothetical protein [Clostridia bacterium]
MLKEGEIVRGSQFPETVELKKCEAIDDNYFVIEALGRETKKYYELVFDRDQIDKLQRLSVQNLKKLTRTDLQHLLRYKQLQVEKKFSSSRALGGENLLPLPHQIEAVYSTMLQVPQVRFLLADDPGAGKTIMSGMLIKELLARFSIERILILVPPLVLKQWQEELNEKFNLSFTIINRETLRSATTNPFIENDFCLSSIYWAARDDIKSFVNEADFDLIIVDEAHKMAAYTHGKRKKKISRTKLYQLGEMILRQAEHCLLLTATPHKGDPENFRHLMRLIDQDIFSNLSATDSLREKSNPFIIRRLKESMKNFDGTPIFPKRITKTITYNLSDPELELYEAVTDYVRYYFNRAINKGNNSTAFAMMLLQRRLSSSIEAIHLSLIRRRDRLNELLTKTLDEREKYLRQLDKIDLDDFDDEAADYQEKIEEKLEQAFDNIDLDELKTELQKLDQLIAKTSFLRESIIERKYEELESTLFGANGLLNQGEKIIIFTEAADTLRYLENRLLKHLPQVAKIVGNYSMEERRRQVELFRDKCQVMLATDAGGESINLQFCNQMINYDIPWNPNKLEQRMGRIHRIGQKNDVAIFNLVAQNTREGDVMMRLLDKMEQMREDLGSDLVYDFIGDVLEEHYGDLASLMQEAIMNREDLNEIIAGMDRKLMEEHEKLIEIVKQERLSSDAIDLPGMRREQNDLTIKRIPTSSYLHFVSHVLEKNKVRVYDSAEGKVKRIERLPKFIRDFARKHNIPISKAHSYRFTGYKDYETDQVELLSLDKPIFQLSLELAKNESEKIALERYTISYPVPEPLQVEIYEVGIVDGTGKELTAELIHLGKRQDGAVISLDPYWLFQADFEGDCIKLTEETEASLKAASFQLAKNVRDRIKAKREKQLNKISEFLYRAFEKQYNETLEKLTSYQSDNVDNRNSALINQMSAKLIDIEARRDERLAEIERQKNIVMKPPKRVVQLEVMPNGQIIRSFNVDFKDIVENYELANGRRLMKTYDNFALVDFYSERYNGEPRFIIISEQPNPQFSEEYMEHLKDILDRTYIYVVREGTVVSEKAMVNEVTLW